MRRRGFIGGCIAAIAGVFGAKAIAETPQDKLKRQMGKLQLGLFDKRAHNELSKLAEMHRQRNPYDYFDDKGVYHHRETLRVPQADNGGMTHVNWVDQVKDDVILVLDYESNRLVNLEAHRCAEAPDASKAYAPVRCETISLDELAALLGQRHSHLHPAFVNHAR